MTLNSLPIPLVLNQFGSSADPSVYVFVPNVTPEGPGLPPRVPVTLVSPVVGPCPQEWTSSPSVDSTFPFYSS